VNWRGRAKPRREPTRAFSLLIYTVKFSEVRLFFHPSKRACWGPRSSTPASELAGDPGLEEKPRRKRLLCIHQKRKCCSPQTGSEEQDLLLDSIWGK
jgi:hypothetical protein